MKIKLISLTFLTTFTLFLLVTPQQALGKETTEKIVLFRDAVNRHLIESYEGVIIEEYKNIPAVKININEAKILSLQSNSQILLIEDEQRVEKSGQMVEWGVKAIQTQKAWNSHYTGKNVKVAIMDSGISPHEDLKIAGGKSFVSYTASYKDDSGHGTHVAGIVGAQNNGLGIVGVAPDARVYALKVLDRNGQGYLSDMIAAIDWAITNNMDVLNLSLGSMEPSYVLERALNKAYKSGMLIVAAGGNEGTSTGNGDNVAYPAKYPAVIAVSAVDQNKVRGSFSATGNAIEFSAPGVGIVSTHLDNKYVSYSGTSMATAFVTGSLALLKEMYPDLSASALREKLGRNALDLGASGKDSWYGLGLVQTPLTPERLSGKDRFEVSANISQKGWDSADTVFISNYNAFADALSAAPLAYKYNSPILLTQAGSLNPVTKQEITRLKAKNIVLIGGSGSLNDSIAKELRGMGKNVRRIGGQNRFEVSKNIALELGTYQTAIVANGLNYPDALAIAPFAAKNGFPILLTRPEAASRETLEVIQKKNVQNTIIVGGEASVSRNVSYKLPKPVRIGGKDRYEVALNIFNKYFADTGKLYFATGTTFADALTGSVLITKENATILLTGKDTLPGSVSDTLAKRKIQTYIILGGTGSVGSNVLSSLSK
ncbi:S8 family serine peptidase [Mesobacillus sp. AQ2]|uniref:S8 family serine peptidase n=1 Tax=Mesobacillus sp. AQ2 TaxID=3043332 RepID=UPI0024C0F4B6|nr:S8 family serine peptidase [Mesobacillus sp. AQ2]WHX40268.1 S8 family serine peptidase [Mesobacillus sp. AQ2]